MSVLLGFFSGAALFFAFLVLTLILTILLQADWAYPCFKPAPPVFERWTGACWVVSQSSRGSMAMFAVLDHPRQGRQRNF